MRPVTWCPAGSTAEEINLVKRAKFAEEKKREAEEAKRHQEFLVRFSLRSPSFNLAADNSICAGLLDLARSQEPRFSHLELCLVVQGE